MSMPACSTSPITRRGRGRAGRDAAARLSLRHPFLCRRGADAGRQGCRVIVPYLRGYGPTRFRDPATPRSGEQAAIGADMMALMDALEIKRAVFAGYDWGGRAACIGAALWPERCIGLVSVNCYLIQDIAQRACCRRRPEREVPLLVPVVFPDRARARRACRQPARDRENTMEAMVAELAFRRCVLRAHRDRPRQSRLCRCRDPQLSPSLTASRKAIRTMPICKRGWRSCRRSRCPPITLDGDGDGVAPATDGSASAAKFTGRRAHRVIPRAGHNLPQEEPEAFAAAVMELVRA